MNFDSNFFIIIFILISILLYFNLSSEKFEDKQSIKKCSDVKAISVNSELNNSEFCPDGCKTSLTKDDKRIYCVDDI
jgi:hypothetical protein